MAYHTFETIAAIGTAAGGAARGMVRVSGPAAVTCVSQAFVSDLGQPELESVTIPQVVTGKFQLAGGRANVWQISQSISCDAFLWPSERSYTRQPTVELHTLGSPPLLELVLQTLCNNGCRVAEPGEFTLRSFLAGRIDLTQAEAVLGVIDATGEDQLHQSLAQLAGGLSRPLGLLREQLLSLLAELEAGLDFAEEDIEFISQGFLRAQLAELQEKLDETIQQLATRGKPNSLPRVVLVGKPNVGKSSLFNALVESFAADEIKSSAIVSDQSGTTRDYLTAQINLGGIECELVDTAGEDRRDGSGPIEQAAQQASSDQNKRGTLRIECVEISDAGKAVTESEGQDAHISLLTKSDLFGIESLNSIESVLACSSTTGDGIAELAERMRTLLAESVGTGAAALTSARCGESLREARHALERSIELADQNGGEELIAAELRDALQHLGRVVGAIVTDDILDRIFSQFCIGK